MHQQYYILQKRGTCLFLNCSDSGKNWNIMFHSKLGHVQGRIKRVVKSLGTMKYENSLKIAVADLEKLRIVDRSTF